MKTVNREIVGAFIFSHDGYVLLGMNRPGGVYEGSWTIPGGGVELNESNLVALKREIMEEVGLDISEAKIEKLESKYGESSAISKETGEKVLIKMSFNDYKVTLPKTASEVIVTSGDDFSLAQWFSAEELKDLSIAAPAKKTLKLLTA
jgi:8-oxo-dGTP pyrophosphatase MutT (NUDIX family)